MREKRRPPWQGDNFGEGWILDSTKNCMINFVGHKNHSRNIYLKGKDGSFEGDECSPEGEAAQAEREVITL